MEYLFFPYIDPYSQHTLSLYMFFLSLCFDQHIHYAKQFNL